LNILMANLAQNTCITPREAGGYTLLELEALMDGFKKLNEEMQKETNSIDNSNKTFKGGAAIKELMKKGGKL